MKINFKENVNSLETRIKIHDVYGSKNIDHWMLKKINLKKSQSILDLGCGDGKQTFAIKNFFSKKLKTKSYKITGLDSHNKLIKNANFKQKNKNIKFVLGSFDKRLPFIDNSFDLVISSFAIYYSKNIEKTLVEIKRVLKKNGKMFLLGPMPNNKFEFNRVLEKASNKKIPKLIGSSRFSTEIFTKSKKIFKKAKIEVFKNELKFNNYEPFFDYTKSTLEKKRNVYAKFLKNKNIKIILEKVKLNLKTKILIKKRLKITKLVGGITAYK